MATRISDVPAHRLRALVVDDSPIARYILSCELERLGYQVEVAETAESALRQLGAPLPDVIFMDHLLPGIDGLEAVSQLRGRGDTSRLPVVMYTSQDGNDFAERARTVGADDIYIKAADESRLVEILGRLDLLPKSSSTVRNGAKVTPIRHQQNAARGQHSSMSLEQLKRLLEPSLDVHHKKLRQELLGEFAILERYEERMRRALFARVEMLERQSRQRFDDAWRAERAARRRGGRRLALLAAVFAACMLVIATLGVRFAQDTVARSDLLQQLTSSTLEATQSNAETLASLQQELDQRPALATSQPSIDTASPVAMVRETTLPNAATALVDELQAMGILGPVRIETSAGAFCVSSGAGAAALTAAYGPLQSCEQLPLQLAARSGAR